MEMEKVKSNLETMEKLQKDMLEKTQDLLREIKIKIARRPMYESIVCIVKNANGPISIGQIIKTVSKEKGRRAKKTTVQSTLTEVLKYEKVERVGPGEFKYRK